MGKTKKGFVCMGGCNGFSPKAKNCGTKGCPHYGKPLVKGVFCEACGTTFLKHKH